MDKIKNFRPRFLPSCLLALTASGVSIYSVTVEQLQIPSGIVYPIYVAAAWGIILVTWATVLCFRANSPVAYVKQLAGKRHFTNRLVNDWAYRTVAVNYLSLGLNTLYAMIKAIMAILMHSTWIGILAGYYIILSIARFLLARSSRNLPLVTEEAHRTVREWKTFRFSGILLALTTLFLSGSVLQLVYKNQGYHYDGMLIYVVALYDFYSFICSITYMIKSAKEHTPLVQAIRIFSFASSLVSILSLQSAMFASFGNDMDLRGQQMMNGLTGTAVCLTLVIMGIAMTAKAQWQIKSCKGKEQ